MFVTRSAWRRIAALKYNAPDTPAQTAAAARCQSIVMSNYRTRCAEIAAMDRGSIAPPTPGAKAPWPHGPSR